MFPSADGDVIIQVLPRQDLFRHDFELFRLLILNRLVHFSLMFFPSKLLIQSPAFLVFLLKERDGSTTRTPQDDFTQKTIDGHEKHAKDDENAEIAPLVCGVVIELFGDVFGTDDEIRA